MDFFVVYLNHGQSDLVGRTVLRIGLTFFNALEDLLAGARNNAKVARIAGN